MRSRRHIIFLLTFILVLGNVAFCFADSKLSEYKVIEIANKFIKDATGITVDNKNFERTAEFIEDSQWLVILEKIGTCMCI